MRNNILRDLLLAVFLVALLVLIAVKMHGRGEESFAGTFRVIDGDSLALGKVKMRLAGIDAPELTQVCTRPDGNWPCGKAARERMQQFVLMPGFACRGSRLDKYRRQLVTCFSGATDINAGMVRAGFAVAFGRYEREESEAQQDKLGIWAGSFTRPQDWRKAHRAGFEDEAPHWPGFLRRMLGWGS